MSYKLSTRLWTLSLMTALLILPPIKELSAQQDKVAALKQSIAQNNKKLQQYQWTETTIISLKGEEKSRIQKRCSYGPDGKVQKQQISAPAPEQSKPGIRGKIIEKKKAEITDYMQRAIALIHEYVPPDPERVQAAQSSGKLSLSPVGQGALLLVFKDFVKPSDSLSFNIDGANLAMQKVEVKSYLDSPKDDPITLTTTFASLSDGANYAANSVLNAPAKNIQVVIQNSDYQKAGAVNQGPAQQPQGTQSAATQGQAAPALSSQQIDSLTAPIALYPDALLAQMLTASTNFPELQSFGSWLAKNASLTGSALQDAAHNAGYDACFVALAPFPQVVQMMIQKPDWTKQLGQLFATNRDAVFDSIQRLRAQAQAAGNLQSTSQQEVVIQTTSTGQQVIVIQPANPQVIYVPQYSSQVVYTSSSSTTTAAVIGFTTGVIIGASASNHYYYGPYAWHGAAMYNEAWNTRYNYASDLQQNRQNYANQRQDTYQQNASQRQSTAQTNQSQRQTSSQANQAQRQSSAQANQAERQSSAATAQTTAQGNQAQRQSSAQANQAERQSSAATAQTTAQGNQAQRQSTGATAQSNAQGNQAQRQSSAATTQTNAQGNQAQRQSSAATAQSNRQAQQGQRQSAASTSSLGTGQGAGQRSGMSSGGLSGYQGGTGVRAESARGNSSLASARGGGGGGGGGGGRGGRR